MALKPVAKYLMSDLFTVQRLWLKKKKSLIGLNFTGLASTFDVKF